MTMATKSTTESMVASLHKAQSKLANAPKGLKLFNTDDLSYEDSFFHGIIYGETGMRKTTMSAQFGKSEETLVILTRHKEQLIPLKGMGVEVALVEDAASLHYALLYTEKVWKAMADTRKDRGLKPLGDLKYIVLDDCTEAVNILLDDQAEDEQGRKRKDARKTYLEAGKELREILKMTFSKKAHVILIALAKVRPNPVTGEESIGPNLPPSMLDMVVTEMEFAFYVKPSNFKLLTQRDQTTFTKLNPETNKQETITRTIFAKSKFPVEVIEKNGGKGPLEKYETANLDEIWRKVSGRN